MLTLPSNIRPTSESWAFFTRATMADPCAPRGPGRLIGVIFCLLMVLILAREIGALMGARVELPGMTENPAWTSPAAIRENAVGTLPVVHERTPGEGVGEEPPAEAPVDARPATKRPPYGVNESVRLEEVDKRVMQSTARLVMLVDMLHAVRLARGEVRCLSP